MSERTTGGNNIPIKVEKQKFKDGWMNGAKGTRRIIWERGLLHPNKDKLHSKEGKLLMGVDTSSCPVLSSLDCNLQ